MTKSLPDILNWIQGLSADNPLRRSTAHPGFDGRKYRICAGSRIN
ncbi:hypothetical protein RRSWK_00711 [Rhodopirellula sp. SWK7]|nr:hypothetical protein RRSWK_00711 [Rhodopirellula sp. SWK7]